MHRNNIIYFEWSRCPSQARPFLEAVLLHMIVILCDVEFFQSYAIVVQKRFKVNEEDLSNIVKM